MPDPQLASLSADDLAELEHRLALAGLPDADLHEPGRRFYRLDDGGDDGGDPRGWVGLELYGEDALLRSLVVPKERRGRGDGRLLVDAAIAEARGSGVARLWLLTTTAADFFARLGFTAVERSSAPSAIRATREFADICPASAVCMVLPLSK